MVMNFRGISGGTLSERYCRFYGTQTTFTRGRSFEKRVAKLMKDKGKLRVKQNVVLVDRNRNRSEIDVCYGLLFRTYVECKNYGISHVVPLDDVAKFKSVLELNNIPPSRGVFITSSKFSPRATTIGIRCIDGSELKRMERRVKTRKRILFMLRFVIIAFLFGFLYLMTEGT